MTSQNASAFDRGFSRVRVNENGRRIGEDHPMSKISDANVDAIRNLRDEGISYGQISKQIGIPKSTVRDICLCRCRAQICVGVRVIEEKWGVIDK